MHIAFLTPEYPHPKVKHAAGIGTSIHNLVVALVRHKVKVSVFVYGQKNTVHFEENGVYFHLLEDKKYAFGKWFLYRKYIQNYINRTIIAEKIDVLEVPDWTGITAFMQFKIPVVMRFHGSDTYFCHLEKRKQKWKNFFFEKMAVSAADAFIAPTNFAGVLSKKLFTIKNKKIQTIPNGLDLSRFVNPNPHQKEEGLLLYIGTIIRKKGVFELPAIFARVRQQCPNSRLILIGSDSADIQTASPSSWELLLGEFSATDLAYVSYLGKKPYSEVQDYIQKATVCVFPTFAETLGMVTIEAMAMQKAVVNSNIGWAQELMIDNQSGYLVHPQDHDNFAEKIIALLVDADLNNQMGQEARKYIKAQFDIENLVIDNIGFYHNLIR